MLALALRPTLEEVASTSGWIWGIGGLVLACASCQLVSGLDKLHSSSGATGGSGGTIGTSVTTGNSTTSATPTTVTGTSSTTGKTTGALGTGTTSAAATTTATTSTSSGVQLVPCGNVTDTLATLNGNMWASNNALESGGEVDIGGSNSLMGYIRLQGAGSYSECYVTIEILTQEPQTFAWAAVVDANAPQSNAASINYSVSAQTITMSNGGTMLSSSAVFAATHLGIALHAGSVYFLHTTNVSGNWTFDGLLPRPAWMNGTTDTAQISVTANTAGQRHVAYRNFNIKSIALSDLP